MGTVLKTRIVKIGNSRGIRIPKILLDQLGVRDQDEVELAVQEAELIVRPIQHARHGWEDQFRLMAEHGDDYLLDEPMPALTEYDTSEWEWS